VIETKIPDVTEFARIYLGVEPTTELVPIQPTAHYAMGGIPTNNDTEVLADERGTVLEGLYAAGEVACVSVHGANRLGTNSLVDLVVFGKRGHTIDAIQYLANAVLWRGAEGERKEVVVDAAGYRERRRGSLEDMADRAASEALQSGHPVALEPMTAVERRIVHELLKDDPEVETASEGAEPTRFVVVVPRRSAD